MIDIPNKNSAYNFNLSEENMGNNKTATNFKLVSIMEM